MSGDQDKSEEEKRLPSPGRPHEILFRKAALDRLTLREESDEAFLVTPGRRWVLFLAGALLAAAAVIWAFWAKWIEV